MTPLSREILANFITECHGERTTKFDLVCPVTGRAVATFPVSTGTFMGCFFASLIVVSTAYLGFSGYHCDAYSGKYPISASQETLILEIAV